MSRKINNMDDTIQHKTCRHYWFGVLILLAVTAVVLVTIIMALQKNDINDQFSVTAIGKVTAIPDIANITIGVYTDAKFTTAKAVKSNTEKMNKIIAVLKTIDIEKKDITTTNYNLNPVYDWTDKNRRKLKGYEVRQNVKIKIRNLDNIGKVIQMTTEQGINQIGGVSFSIDDPDELKKEAVNIAIAKAKIKAKDLSKASGLKIGKLINVYASQAQLPIMRTNKAYAEYGMLANSSGGVLQPTIEAGEQEVSVEMTLVYKVK